MASQFYGLVTRRLSSFDVQNVHPSVVSSLSVALVFLISSWRHYDTYDSPNPFQQEVWIEWLSWILIFAFHKCFDKSAAQTQSYKPSEPQPLWSTKKAVWATAALAISSQLLSGQRSLTWVLPLTTIAVTAVSRAYPVDQASETVSEEKLSSLSVWLDLSPTADGLKENLRTPSSIILNLVCCALFFEYREIITTKSVLLDSALFLITRSAAIHAISRLGKDAQNDAQESHRPDTAEVISMLSMPILVILTAVLVVVQPDLSMSSIVVLSHSLAQAVWWLAIITLVRSRLPNTAVNLDTVALSSEMALTSKALRRIAPALIALVVSVTQSVVVLRPGAGVRKIVYGLVLVFGLGLWFRHDPRFVTDMTPTPNGHFTNGHPIENLITANRKRFDALLARQSTTLTQAVAEYQRRYGRRPPLGFDKWFQLAQDNKMVLIDEFDTMTQSLEPFHGIHPDVLLQRLQKVLEVAAGQTVTYNITNGNLTMSDGVRDVGERLTNTTWLDIIPYNMSLVINGFDEAMVSAPWEEVRKAIADSKVPDRYAHKMSQSNVSPLLQVGGQSAWAATSHACSVYSPARQVECPAARHKITAPLPFINNVTLSKDVCQNCELLQESGFLMGPDTLNIAHELVPIWSASKPSNFHDVLYPSSYYILVRDDYDSKEDSSWEDKDNVFYWTGTATGGRVTEANWKMMQRQRMVLKTQKGSKEAIQLLEEVKNGGGSGTWQPRFTTMAEISDLFKTRISRVVQCSEEACEQQKEAFGIDVAGTQDGLSDSYAHKFVMDIDGNTFSGRFYRLLRSRSMVVKQTIFREWHDDRLIPWVHYAPVTTSFEELPEMARFFANTQKGLDLAKRMAMESTEWHNKALRDVDIRLAWLRMLLEYGRLMSPELELSL